MAPETPRPDEESGSDERQQAAEHGDEAYGGDPDAGPASTDEDAEKASTQEPAEG